MSNATFLTTSEARRELSRRLGRNIDRNALWRVRDSHPGRVPELPKFGNSLQWSEEAISAVEQILLEEARCRGGAR